MPRTTREWARRKLEMAAQGLDAPMAHLLETKVPYAEPPHSEDMLKVASNCEELAEQLLMIQQLILGLRGQL